MKAIDQAPEGWMRPALAWLYDAAEPELARNAIQDPSALTTLRQQLEAAIDAGGSAVPDGERGNNLVLALVALRLKFPRLEAEAKLETNLALRKSA